MKSVPVILSYEPNKFIYPSGFIFKKIQGASILSIFSLGQASIIPPEKIK